MFSIFFSFLFFFFGGGGEFRETSQDTLFVDIVTALCLLWNGGRGGRCFSTSQNMLGSLASFTHKRKYETKSTRGARGRLGTPLACWVTLFIQ